METMPTPVYRLTVWTHSGKTLAGVYTQEQYIGRLENAVKWDDFKGAAVKEVGCVWPRA